MTNTELKDSEIELIEDLKTLFGAEPETYHLDKEELRFMEERDKLEEEIQWSFEKYVESYELIKAYGLE